MPIAPESERRPRLAQESQLFGRGRAAQNGVAVRVAPKAVNDCLVAALKVQVVFHAWLRKQRKGLLVDQCRFAVHVRHVGKHALRCGQRLLNLAEPAQQMLMAGDIDMGHARALLSLDRGTQITAANQIAAKKMSVREAEALVKKLAAEFTLTPSRRSNSGEKSRDLQRVEEELADLLTAEVEVRIKKRSKRGGRIEESGELAIHFGSIEALNGLIERIRRTA